MTLARDWHALSDHAADGAPFGSPICNCERQSERVQVLITAERNRLADEIEAEHLTDDTGLSEDIAYDLAIDHAARIVRAHNDH